MDNSSPQPQTLSRVNKQQKNKKTNLHGSEMGKEPSVKEKMVKKRNQN